MDGTLSIGADLALGRFRRVHSARMNNIELNHRTFRSTRGSRLVVNTVNNGELLFEFPHQTNRGGSTDSVFRQSTLRRIYAYVAIAGGRQMLWGREICEGDKDGKPIYDDR